MAILIPPAELEEEILTEDELLAKRVQAQAERRAKRVTQGCVDTTNVIVSNLVKGLNSIWLAPNPQAVLDVLGGDATEAFALSRDTAAYIIPQLTGKRDDLVEEINQAFSNVKPYTENSDGTVTID